MCSAYLCLKYIFASHKEMFEARMGAHDTNTFPSSEGLHVALKWGKYERISDLWINYPIKLWSPLPLPPASRAQPIASRYLGSTVE